MSLARDLLEQARHLAGREPTKPKQASLRRAVSAADYGMFHLLTEAAARRLVRGSKPTQVAQRALVQRAFSHGPMKHVCASWWGTKQKGAVHSEWRSAVGTDTLSGELQQVADAFVELQEARHEADYNVARRFTRQDAADMVRRAERAFAAWERVSRSSAPECDAFLVALLVG